MKHLVITIVLSLGIAGSVVGQDLNKYKYVQVPPKFEFLKEENQYQLNALTAFLLEKYGFKVLYEEQVPSGTDICEVLKADVHNRTSIFRSRLYFTLKDCHGKDIFVSKTGTSREKDFQKSYQEALRDALTSLEGLRMRSEVIIDPVLLEKDGANDSLPVEVVVDPVPAFNEVQKEVQDSIIVIDPVVAPVVRDIKKENDTGQPKASKANYSMQFTNAAVIYHLEKSEAGYDLFREGEKDKFGTLIKSGGGENYLYSAKNISGNAFFDTQGNLVVEYLDPNTQQLVSVLYKRKHQ